MGCYPLRVVRGEEKRRRRRREEKRRGEEEKGKKRRRRGEEKEKRGTGSDISVSPRADCIAAGIQE